MGCQISDNMVICGNFAEVLPEKPKDFDYDSDAKWLEPYPEKWERIKIGKTTCTCQKIETHYQPWYGYSWFHTDECALMQRVKDRPSLLNLPAFWNVKTIGYSD